MLEGTPTHHRVQILTEIEVDLKVLDHFELFKSQNYCSLMKEVTKAVRLVGIEIFLV